MLSPLLCSSRLLASRRLSVCLSVCLPMAIPSHHITSHPITPMPAIPFSSRGGPGSLPLPAPPSLAQPSLARRADSRVAAQRLGRRGLSSHVIGRMAARQRGSEAARQRGSSGSSVREAMGRGRGGGCSCWVCLSVSARVLLARPVRVWRGIVLCCAVYYTVLYILCCMYLLYCGVLYILYILCCTYCAVHTGVPRNTVHTHHTTESPTILCRAVIAIVRCARQLPPGPDALRRCNCAP